MASFLKMAVAYKKKIGFTAQFTIEPKAREPTAHQYDYDAQTVIGFLYQQFGGASEVNPLFCCFTSFRKRSKAAREEIK